MSFKKTNSDQIDAAESDYLYVKVSQLHNSGNGLFTAIDIYKDEIVALFLGEIINNEQAKTIAENGKDNYFMNLLNGGILDCMYTDCFAKYANDAIGFSKSDFKNNTKITLDENENVCLIAIKKIKSGEEIFCDNGKNYWRKNLISNII